MKILGFNYKETVFLQYKRNSWNECRGSAGWNASKCGK